jgi:hypothetical protein
MAAVGIDASGNCGGQFYCRFNLEQIIRLWLAELSWRCDRRSDSGTDLGVFEAHGIAEEIK